MDFIRLIEDMASRCTFKDFRDYKQGPNPPYFIPRDYSKTYTPSQTISKAPDFMSSLVLSQLEEKKFVESVASGNALALSRRACIARYVLRGSNVRYDMRPLFLFFDVSLQFPPPPLPGVRKGGGAAS